MTEHQSEVYDYLKQKYNKLAISKREMADEIGLSVAAINKRISECRDLPEFKKMGDAKSSRVIFPIYNVALYIGAGNVKTA